MSGIGQVLRKRREELGLSLEDIQEQTKVRKRYIQAIEDDDWSSLPGDVYARGFIRSYAEALGMDGLALLRQLDEEAAVRPSQTDSGNRGIPDEKPQQEKRTSTFDDRKLDNGPAFAPRRTTPSPLSSSRNPARSSRNTYSSNTAPRHNKGHRGASRMGQAASIVIILAVLAGGWWALAHHSGGQPNQPVGSITNTPGNSTENTAGAGGNSTSNSTNNSTNNNTNNNAGNNSTANAPSSGAPQVTVTAQPFTNGTATFLVKTTNPLQVVMSVTQPCWIQIVKQDSQSGSTAGLTVQANQSQSWTVQQVLTLRLGHYPGVTLTVNGQPVSLPKINSPYNVSFVKS